VWTPPKRFVPDSRVGGARVVSDDEGDLGLSDLQAGGLVHVQVAVGALRGLLILAHDANDFRLVDLDWFKATNKC